MSFSFARPTHKIGILPIIMRSHLFDQLETEFLKPD